MRTLFRPLARLTRLAALLVWAAQLGVTAAPVADGRASAAPHVEADGTRLHYAHCPELCPACAAAAIAGAPELPAPVHPAVAGARTQPQAVAQRAVPTPRLVAAQPRAPPA
jgi:hypothetical protein